MGTALAANPSTMGSGPLAVGPGHTDRCGRGIVNHHPSYVGATPLIIPHGVAREEENNNSGLSRDIH